MSVLCKGCRKTKINEDFGLKDNGTQYKTCITCRNKKIKKIEEKEEEIIECCDAELIRDTFRKLNCRIVYLKELKYMMGLDRTVAKSIFGKMVMCNNIAIIESITLSNICSILNLLEHIGVHTMNIRSYGMNIVIYKNSKDTMFRALTGSDLNKFEGFMKCIKLPNKKMCDMCNYKKKCFRQCVKCINKFWFECSRTITKTMLIHVLTYCRYNVVEHNKTNSMLDDMFG